MKTLEELKQLAQDIYDDVKAGDMDVAVRTLAALQEDVAEKVVEPFHALGTVYVPPEIDDYEEIDLSAM